MGRDFEGPLKESVGFLITDKKLKAPDFPGAVNTVLGVVEDI